MNKIQLKKLRKRYNQEDDRSKQGEQRSRGEGSGFGETECPVKRPSEFEGRGVLPTTTPKLSGEDSPITGEDSDGAGETDKLDQLVKRFRES